MKTFLIQIDLIPFPSQCADGGDYVTSWCVTRALSHLSVRRLSNVWGFVEHLSVQIADTHQKICFLFFRQLSLSLREEFGEVMRIFAKDSSERFVIFHFQVESFMILIDALRVQIFFIKK